MEKRWLAVMTAIAALAAAEGEIQSQGRGGQRGPDADWFAGAVLYLTGETELENLDEEQLERFSDMSRTPLRINYCGRRELSASGLFSVYQVASLMDYRARNGDVLSFAELSALDGFNSGFVDAVSHFVSLESSSIPGARAGKMPPDISSDTNLSLKSVEDKKVQLSSWHRLHISSEGKYDIGLAAKKGYGESILNPSSYCGSVSFTGPRQRGRVVFGDYALRFGQGLGLWSGFSVSGFSGQRSFSKRPTGISPSRSLSPAASHRGIAADYETGRFRLSAFTSLPGFRYWCESGRPISMSVMPGINAAWFSSSGTVSLTTFCIFPTKSSNDSDGFFARVSADSRFCINGIDIYGEAAFDCLTKKASAVAGLSLPVNDDWSISFAGRWIPEGYNLACSSPVRAFSGKKGESGAAAGLFYKKMSLTADIAFNEPDTHRRQLKVLFDCPLEISPAVMLLLRATERLRSYGLRTRTDIRADLKWTCRSWQSVFRLNVLECKSFSGLVYAEEGYVGGRGAVFLRSTFFIVDNWDDRIYSYERDAPGTFNVPACYGRGYALSLVARKRFDWRSCALKLYFRTGYVSHPWSSPGKDGTRPSVLEAKFQFSVDF
ncbi:MAG: hypothetical protein ACI3ZT_07590 [Candidatus Cryptobacteroides sp.]